MLADLVFIAAAVAVLALLVAWEIFLLRDLAYADRVRLLPRWLWGALCLAQIPLGGIAYLLIGRVWKRQAQPGPPTANVPLWHGRSPGHSLTASRPTAC